MPEAIRLKVGGVTQQQMAVYEEFARNIPGFLPLTDRDFLLKPSVTMEPQPHPSTPFQVTQVLASDEVITLYEKLALEADQFVQMTNGQTAYTVMNSNMQSIRDCLITAIHNRDVSNGMPIIQKVLNVKTIYVISIIMDLSFCYSALKPFKKRPYQAIPKPV